MVCDRSFSLGSSGDPAILPEKDKSTQDEGSLGGSHGRPSLRELEIHGSSSADTSSASSGQNLEDVSAVFLQFFSGSAFFMLDAEENW